MIPARNASFLVLVVAATVAMLAFVSRAAAAAEPITAAANSLRTAWYPENPQLTPALLEEKGGFGPIFNTPVQGQVYAQPLVFGQTLLAATEDNWIYGIDPKSGAIQWSRNVGNPWNSADIGCTDLEPHVGITGTPVIDPATNIAYFFSKTYASGSSGPAVWKMHAVDLANGEEQPGFPKQISGEAQNLPGVEFNPTQQLQRPALLLMNGVVYAAFGSHCDIQPYEGWIVGVSTAGQIKTMWATASSGSAIWQAGGGLISDREGQILFTTGNGPSPPPGRGDSPPEGELGESVVRVAVQPDGTLKATDFFSPFENTRFSDEDLDLGSGAPIALPSPYFGTKAIPHLMVEVGKPGIIYLLNRDDLGGMGQGAEEKDEVVQELPETGGLWGSIAAWPGDGGYLYIPAVGSGTLEMLKYEALGEIPHLSVVGQGPGYLGYGSGSPIVTSNGTSAGSGIVWISECSNPPECEGSTLDAYSAVPVEGSAKLLWSGEIGVSTKFAPPAAGEGRIYVGTRDGHLLGFGAEHYTLNVRRESEAGGSVSSSLGGIACGASCSHTFGVGEQVTLTATPAEHFEFIGWSGGGCSGTGPCRLTIDSETAVTANFAPILHRLTVAKAGSGSGTVSSEPAGIQCGASCSARFREASAVALSATPAPHSSFVGWSGPAAEGCGSNVTCKLTIGTADSALTATFTGSPGTKLTRVRIQTRRRTARFGFSAIGPSVGFQCELIRPKSAQTKSKPGFASCASPKTYRRLRPGRYTFEVRAFNSAGPDPTPIKRKFKI
jgi:outer membrane protein assembly factor BamB